MNTGRTVLAQLFDFISKYEFAQSVNKYQGNYKSQTFSCWEQYSGKFFRSDTLSVRTIVSTESFVTLCTKKCT